VKHFKTDFFTHKKAKDLWSFLHKTRNYIVVPLFPAGNFPGSNGELYVSHNFFGCQSRQHFCSSTPSAPDLANGAA